VHPTGGSLRVFKQFSWLEAGSGKAALSHPTHQRVTRAVSPLSEKEPRFRLLNMNHQRIMTTKRTSVWLILGLLLLFLIWIPKAIIHISGENRSLIVDNAWVQAQNSWSQANYLTAVGEYIQASWMTIDCSVRFMIGEHLFQQASILEQQGQLNKAVDVCKNVATLIDQYDSEGARYYGCANIEMRYYSLPSGNTSPTSVPTIEP
jgi:hypothetical protein